MPPASEQAARQAGEQAREPAEETLRKRQALWKTVPEQALQKAVPQVFEQAERQAGEQAPGPAKETRCKRARKTARRAALRAPATGCRSDRPAPTLSGEGTDVRRDSGCFLTAGHTADKLAFGAFPVGSVCEAHWPPDYDAFSADSRGLHP